MAARSRTDNVSTIRREWEIDWFWALVRRGEDTGSVDAVGLGFLFAQFNAGAAQGGSQRRALCVTAVRPLLANKLHCDLLWPWSLSEAWISHKEVPMNHFLRSRACSPCFWTTSLSLIDICRSCEPEHQIQDESLTPDGIFLKSVVRGQDVNPRLHSPRPINSFNDVLFVVVRPFYYRAKSQHLNINYIANFNWPIKVCLFPWQC